MKKIMAILAALMMLFAFAACSSHDCDDCGKEGEGTNKVEANGETGYFCDNCAPLAELGAAIAGN